MPLFTTSLNSGSNANCYYVGTEQDAVLIDAGLSCAETELRLARLGLPMSQIRGVFVSHEHTDHIRGLVRLAKKHYLPVYITPGTLRESLLPRYGFDIRPFRADEPVTLGSLTVRAFSKQHDAADPHSFLVQSQATTVGVFTDIGMVCENLIQHFGQCHAAFLEANYDEAMLENGRYPYVLKQRIRGGRGHLSNEQALALFRTHKPPFMTHLFLAHLSQHNNSPTLAHDLFSPHLAGTELIVAPRTTQTPVYRIGGQQAVLPVVG
jgi:phosphoribosyl 1,2-cyclic phosphodiesterase